MGQNDPSDLRFDHEILWFFDGDFRVLHFAIRPVIRLRGATPKSSKKHLSNRYVLNGLAAAETVRETI